MGKADLPDYLKTPDGGLSVNEAAQGLTDYGANRLLPQKRSDVLSLLIAQFKSL